MEGRLQAEQHAREAAAAAAAAAGAAALSDDDSSSEDVTAAGQPPGAVEGCAVDRDALATASGGEGGQSVGGDTGPAAAGPASLQFAGSNSISQQVAAATAVGARSGERMAAARPRAGGPKQRINAARAAAAATATAAGVGSSKTAASGVGTRGGSSNGADDCGSSSSLDGATRAGNTGVPSNATIAAALEVRRTIISALRGVNTVVLNDMRACW